MVNMNTSCPLLMSFFVFFGPTDRLAKFKYNINASSQGKLYFYLDETWSYAYAEADCSRRIAMSKFSSEFEKIDSVMCALVLRVVCTTVNRFLLQPLRNNES